MHTQILRKLNSRFALEHRYSMLEVVTHAQETTVMEVEQFFEAIEDPLLNMLVPIVVQIAVDAMKPTLVGGLCMALPPVLATIFAMPTQMGMAGAAAAFDGGGLLGGLFGFLAPKGHGPKMWSLSFPLRPSRSHREELFPW